MLTARGISKKYPRKMKDSNFFYAVNTTDIELAPGTITAVIGRSGSGKTTLLNMLSGLLQPSEGEILFQAPAEDTSAIGIDAAALQTSSSVNIFELSDNDLSELRNKYFGVIPQGQTAIDSLTVFENILLPTALYIGNDRSTGRKTVSDSNASVKQIKSNTSGISQDFTDRAYTLLEQFDIAHLAEAFPKELSGGELRRLAIARAMIMSPAILFADEPTGDLDDENTKVILEAFRSAADSGTAVMMVTHETDALDYADTVYKMDAGNLQIEPIRQN